MDNWITQIADKFFAEIELYVEDNQPTIGIENDGIGYYEYGSICAFDRGTDYPVITNSEDVHYVTLDDMPVMASRLYDKVAKDLNSTLDDIASVVYIDRGVSEYDDTEYRVEWKAVKITGAINALRVEIEFGEVETK